MQSPTPEKCHCVSAGLCPLYKKFMDEHNIDWCKNASPEHREIYQNSYNGPIALTKDANRFISIYYDADYQIDTSNIQIAALGHSKKQFNTIQDQPYIKKVYLDDLDLGRYSRFQSNAYAESRAFLCDDLFDADVDYVGTVTASWNLKYQGLHPIDEFHNWHAGKALLKSNRKDVVLCADVLPPAIWFGGYKDFFVLPHLGFSNRQRKRIENILFNDLKLVGRSGFSSHSPLSNQMICHKDMYNKYVNFFRGKEILDRFQRLFSKYDMRTGNDCTDQRPIAFIIESVTMLWFGMQADIECIPNEARLSTWYDDVFARLEWYQKKKND